MKNKLEVMAMNPMRTLQPCYKLFAALVLVGISAQTNAATITTIFASNNQFHGNMFDVTTFGNLLVVTGLDVNVVALSAVQINVYTKPGTFVGSATNPAAWTLVSSTSGVTAAGLDNPTFVDVTDFLLPASTLTGMYVTLVSPSTPPAMRYTNGSNVFANADLSLDLGIGLGGLFGSSGTFDPRTWNGTIYYNVGAVPIPAALPLFLSGLAIFGFVARRRERG